MENDVKEVITLPLKDIGVEVIDVRDGVEDNEKTLFIVIDSKEGVTISLCEKATKIINPLLDTLKYDFDSYVIDVSSKGIENE
ncbi:MAG: hypothetical protein RSG51_01320 [Bacilli bacterium]